MTRMTILSVVYYLYYSLSWSDSRIIHQCMPRSMHRRLNAVTGLPMWGSPAIPNIYIYMCRCVFNKYIFIFILYMYLSLHLNVVKREVWRSQAWEALSVWPLTLASQNAWLFLSTNRNPRSQRSNDERIRAQVESNQALYLSGCIFNTLPHLIRPYYHIKKKRSWFHGHLKLHFTYLSECAITGDI